MDMKRMLMQAQLVQKKIEAFKKEEFSFSKSGGLINLVITGNREIITLDIENLVKEVGDDFEMMSDMLKVALNESFAEIDKKEKKITGNFK